MEEYTTISAGKYNFQVKRTIHTYNGNIITRTYMLGGDYPRCVNITYKYKNNIPIEAFLPHLLYEPECALRTTLERGDGSVIMIKATIEHAFKEVPSITTFKFDDMSKIDCIPKNVSIPPERKVIKPLNLAHFSIAYHDKTWYELHFNAEMMNKIKYAEYRERIKILKDPAMKVSYGEFLEIAQPPQTQFEFLEPLYIHAKTYREFFNAIPKTKRCDILYEWLSTFIIYYLWDVYDENNWTIDVKTMNNNIVTRGGGGSYTRKNGKTTNKKQKYRIYDYKTVQSF